METFTKRVKTFDAFPKVAPVHTVRSTRGSYSTILTVVCICFIVWVEIGGYFGGFIDHQFSVDETVRKDLLINMDILVAMPCEFIHTNVRDITNDRFLASELLNYEGMNFFLPQSYSINHEHYQIDADLDEVMRESMRAEFRSEGFRINEAAPACHIFGSIPVNRVSGDFHITGKGYGYQDRDRSYVPVEALNFSHVISEFSFGEFYPYLHNPLDFTGKVTTEKLQTYRYFAKVVPTVYQRLGVIIDTNQYSITEQSQVVELSKSVPGISFKYDFEAIKLTIVERRIRFVQFCVRLATIIGGLMICASWLLTTVNRLLIIFFGKRFADRGQEKSTSLLDTDIEEDNKKDY